MPRTRGPRRARRCVPPLRRVLATGECAYENDQLFPLKPPGFVEETYFLFPWSPGINLEACFPECAPVGRTDRRPESSAARR